MIDFLILRSGVQRVRLRRPDDKLLRVSKDEVCGSWFETVQERLLTMRDSTYRKPS
jgi:hypothetical protein